MLCPRLMTAWALGLPTHNKVCVTPSTGSCGEVGPAREGDTLAAAEQHVHLGHCECVSSWTPTAHACTCVNRPYRHSHSLRGLPGISSLGQDHGGSPTCCPICCTAGRGIPGSVPGTQVPACALTLRLPLVVNALPQMVQPNGFSPV